MNIKSNYYYLLRKGFSLEELRNLERHDFLYYIHLYEDELEKKAEAERRANAKQY
jgi:hypothetical protein